MSNQSRRIVAILAGVALAVSFSAVPVQAAGPNLVPDPVLRQCIAEEMSMTGAGDPEEADSITQVDLDALVAAAIGGTTYVICHNGVTSLEGLQYIDTTTTDLYFSFWGGQISDLAPLSGLTNLTTLELNEQQITNLTPLAGLVNLRVLDLSDNQISNASSLAGLAKLERLNLSGNDLNDITNLGILVAGLPNLEVLELRFNQIMDVSPLAGLTDLVGLDLSLNQINDVTALGGLTGLYWLSLGGNLIDDLAPLSGLTDLVGLGLIDNLITDVAPLADLVGLRELYLGINQIDDVTPLADLVGLEQLYLEYNQIDDASPLANLVNLFNLSLSYNQIDDVEPLAGLSNLTMLQIEGNQIADISPLASLTGLELLMLTDNQITDLGPLAGMTAMHDLELGGNQIVDVTPLAGILTNLRYLFLHSNLISDITPIAGWLNSDADIAWTLYDNQIWDVSLLDWDHIGRFWDEVPIDCTGWGVMCYSVDSQDAVATAAVGTVALPKGPANSPHPVVWTVVSGDATIDQAAGTITFHSVGPVVLAWTDEFDAPCPPDSYNPVCDGVVGSVTVASYSGTLTVDVTPAAGPRPGPDPDPGQTVVVRTGGQVAPPLPVVGIALALVLGGAALLGTLLSRSRRTN